MKMSTVAERFASILEVEPDEMDIAAMKRIEEANDKSEGLSLEEMDMKRTYNKCSGKIALRIPRELHFKLQERAKENGVSLNQFLVYKLAE